MSYSKKDELLKTLFKEDIFIKGEIIVRSGQKLNMYCNLKKAFGFPKISKKIVAELKTLIPKQTNCLAVMGFGGIPLGSLVSQETNIPVCYIREQIKDHGTKSQFEGYIPKKEDKICLIDDVYTTGNSLRKSAEILSKNSLKVDSAVVFLNWNETKEDFKVFSFINKKDLESFYNKNYAKK